MGCDFLLTGAGEGGRGQTGYGWNCANLIWGCPGRPGRADGRIFLFYFFLFLDIVGWSVGFGRCCEWVVNIHSVR